MRRIITCMVCGILMLAVTGGLVVAEERGAPVGAASQAPRERPVIHVLLIGNSLIYTNDMPALLQMIAKSSSDGPLIDAVGATRGGWSLERHIKEGNVLQKIGEKKWDFVVLQDHSVSPIKDKAAMLASGRKLDEAIDATGAKTVLMMTWAGKDSPQSQKVITDAYVEMGEALNAQVAPIGDAWAKARNDASVTLFKDDGKHPALAGAYLSACVMYRTLTGRSPVGLAGPDGLTAEQTAVLQKTADEVVMPRTTKEEKAETENAK